MSCTIAVHLFIACTRKIKFSKKMSESEKECDKDDFGESEFFVDDWRSEEEEDTGKGGNASEFFIY